MIKVLTAHTAEIDDIDLAVSEILTQIKPEENLRKHSVGIVSAYAEFIESGVYAALDAKLPFDTVGNTTIGNAVNAESGQLLLTLTVLTSDDVDFATGVSGSLMERQEAPLADAYGRVAATLPEKPAMMLGFMALLQHVGGDIIIDALDRVSGGVPIFGTVTVDHTPDYRYAQVLYNGKAYSDTFVFALIAGKVQPSFMVASVSKEKIRRQQAIITAAQGNVLQEVNSVPVIEYMQSLGLASNGQIEGMNSIPFIINYNDGTTPIARAIFALTPEGYAVCGGVMPVGATLSVGSIDYDDVIATTSGMLREMLGHDGAKHGLLMYSCISRYISLGMSPDAEMETVREIVGDAVPYQFTYSGGEICPVYDQDGKLVNRFHNDTVVACIL